MSFVFFVYNLISQSFHLMSSQNLITIKKKKSCKIFTTFMITIECGLKIILIYGYSNGKVYTRCLKLILYVKNKLIIIIIIIKVFATTVAKPRDCRASSTSTRAADVTFWTLEIAEALQSKALFSH